MNLNNAALLTYVLAFVAMYLAKFFNGAFDIETSLLTLDMDRVATVTTTGAVGLAAVRNWLNMSREPKTPAGKRAGAAGGSPTIPKFRSPPQLGLELIFEKPF
jgi:hypothetical protein